MIFPIQCFFKVLLEEPSSTVERSPIFTFVNETAVNNCFNENLQILRNRWAILRDHFVSSKCLKKINVPLKFKNLHPSNLKSNSKNTCFNNKLTTSNKWLQIESQEQSFCFVANPLFWEVIHPSMMDPVFFSKFYFGAFTDFSYKFAQFFLVNSIIFRSSVLKKKVSTMLIRQLCSLRLQHFFKHLSFFWSLWPKRLKKD